MEEFTGTSRRKAPRHPVATTLHALSALAISTGLTGCVVIGRSGRGGFFFIPGGIGLLVIVLLFLLLSRRR